MSRRSAVAGNFEEKVQRHRDALQKRSGNTFAAYDLARFARSAECTNPVGQAQEWYLDALPNMPPSGRDVALQLARLCGDDSMVTLPWRSLADAVGKADKAGRTRAYAERGVQALTEAGWVRVETTGRGRAARTTFYLLPAPHARDRVWIDGQDGIVNIHPAAA